MRKTMILPLGILLFTMLLSACGNGNENANSSSPSAESAPASSEASPSQDTAATRVFKDY